MWFEKKKLLIGLGLAIFMGLSCAVYNDSCPVTEPEVWGDFNVNLNISREFVRQCEAPIGVFIADALHNYKYGLKDGSNDANPSIGLVNAGAIRDEVSCGTGGENRDTIPKGPVTNQDIFQLHPFEDTVVVVKLTGSQLKDVLEWGVSSLGSGDDDALEGHFLQVSAVGKIEVDVDCSQQQQTLIDSKTISNFGNRINAGTLCIGNANPCFVPDGTYYVATLDYLTRTDDQKIPNDGFAAFQQPGIEVFETHVPVTEAVREWLKTYSSTDGYQDTDYPKVLNRLNFSNCNNECSD